MKCLLLLLGAGFAFGQATPPPSTASADPVVITIGNRKITKSEFEKVLATLPEQQQSQLASPVAKRKLAENFAQLIMLADEAKARKLDESDKVKTQIMIQTDQVLAQNLVDKLAEPTEGDEEAFYTMHKNDWEEVKAQHILIRYKGSSVPLKPDEKDLTEEEALAKAQEIRAKIVAGGDFAALAKTESDDTGNASRGGDLGSFTKGRMVPEFERAAFAAEVGKVTEPVKTKFGYHLILVDAHTTKPFAEVRTEIERRLKQENVQKAIAEVKSKVPVTFDDAYFGGAPAQVPADRIHSTSAPIETSKNGRVPSGSDTYVPVNANCIVYHSGYRGKIVAPNVSEPTGTVVRLECNGKDVEIADSKMVDGIILTKAYGKVRVRFGSEVATVGAGDFTSVPPGGSAVPERVVEISVRTDVAAGFTSRFQ